MISPSKQIVIQEVLPKLVDLIPEISVSENTTAKPFFSFGSEDDLNRYIKATNSVNYPLIWMLPSVNTYNYVNNRVTRRLLLIVATIERRIDISNEQRFADSFSNTLFPIRDYLIHILRHSGVSNIKGEIDTYEFPRYIQEETSVIDNWDAIRIECNVEFNNKQCIKTFNFV